MEQVVGQVGEVPLHEYGRHDGDPMLPEAALAQTPSVAAPAALEQTSHDPLHALLQHRPSAQKPEVHWLPLAHADPFALVNVQTPLPQ